MSDCYFEEVCDVSQQVRGRQQYFLRWLLRVQVLLAVFEVWIGLFAWGEVCVFVPHGADDQVLLRADLTEVQFAFLSPVFGVKDVFYCLSRAYWMGVQGWTRVLCVC